MSKEYIVSVLDYTNSETDIFKMRIKDDEDQEEMVCWAIEQFGHSVENCHYIFAPIGKMKFHIDI